MMRLLDMNMEFGLYADISSYVSAISAILIICIELTGICPNPNTR